MLLMQKQHWKRRAIFIPDGKKVLAFGLLSQTMFMLPTLWITLVFLSLQMIKFTVTLLFMIFPMKLEKCNEQHDTKRSPDRLRHANCG